MLALRPFRYADVPRVVEACSDALTQSYTTVPTPYDEEDAQAFVEGACARRAGGEGIELAAVPRRDERLAVAAVGIRVDGDDPARGEIGYWVHPDARGRGVATRAARLLAAWALASGFVRLDLRAALANVASQRVAERLGFVREGVMRDAWVRHGRRADLVVFSLLARDRARV